MIITYNYRFYQYSCLIKKHILRSLLGNEERRLSLETSDAVLLAFRSVFRYKDTLVDVKC